MTRHFSVYTLVFMFLSTVLLLSVQATQSHGQAATQAWKRVNVTEGCFYYERRWDDVDTRKDTRINWSGPCQPGQPISGQGTLDATWEYRRDDGVTVSVISRKQGAFKGGLQEGEWIEDMWSAPVGRTPVETQRALETTRGYRFVRNYARGCETLAVGACPPLN